MQDAVHTTQTDIHSTSQHSQPLSGKKRKVNESKTWELSPNSMLWLRKERDVAAGVNSALLSPQRCLPTAKERYHMLALGRFYNDKDFHSLQSKCRKGVWTIESLRKAIQDLDTTDPINEHESREIIHIRGFLGKDETGIFSRYFDRAVRKAKFQAGTDSGKTSSWCKYLYVKWRKDNQIYPEFREAFSVELQRRVHDEVKKSLNQYERCFFDEFFPCEEAREISIVHYPIRAKGIKNIGIDAHIDDTIFRTAMLHISGEDKTDNIWIDDNGVMKLVELEPGDLVIFPRLSHFVKPIRRKSARRVCTFFY